MALTVGYAALPCRRLAVAIGGSSLVRRLAAGSVLGEGAAKAAASRRTPRRSARRFPVARRDPPAVSHWARTRFSPKRRAALAPPRAHPLLTGREGGAGRARNLSAMIVIR